MAKRYAGTCQYCGTKTYHGDICANCYHKRKLIRKLQAMVRAMRDGETKHGQWLINSDGYYPYCSVCGEESESGKLTNFCSRCGADMRGENHENN